MSRGGSASLHERLHALASLLPDFESPDFEFGAWDKPAAMTSGNIEMPHYTLSRGAERFLQAAEDTGWILRGFNWPRWVNTKVARRLHEDPSYLERATPEQLARLLTALIRQERFCEGSLEAAHESGLLKGILRRAMFLEAETTQEVS